MSAELDAGFGLTLAASLDGLATAVSGLCGRMDRDAALIQRVNEAYRQVPFIINVPIVAGAGSINPSWVGPDAGFYWSVRKLAAVGFTAGTVNVYVDNTGGEPLVPFPQTGVFTFGGGDQLLHPNSNLAIVAAGITGTVQIWGKADQFEAWLLPWYIGAQRET